MLLKIFLVVWCALSASTAPVDEGKHRRIAVPVAEDLLEDPNEVAAAPAPSPGKFETNGAAAIPSEGFVHVDPSTATVQEMAVFSASEVQKSLNVGPLFVLKVTDAEVRSAVGSVYKLSVELLSFAGTKECDVLISDENCQADHCPWTDSRRLTSYECH